jgi:NDP-sugar pyrophosphorylase family protein
VRISAGAHIGPFASLGDGTSVAAATIRGSIVLESAKISGPVVVHDSIIGRGVVLEGSPGSPREMRLIVGDAAQIRV